MVIWFFACFLVAFVAAGIARSLGGAGLMIGAGSIVLTVMTARWANDWGDPQFTSQGFLLGVILVLAPPLWTLFAVYVIER